MKTAVCCERVNSQLVEEERLTLMVIHALGLLDERLLTKPDNPCRR